MDERFCYLGIVLPQGKKLTDDDYQNLYWNDYSDQMTKMINLKGLPHKLNHLQGITIGKVVDSFVHEGKKYVVGYIDRDTPSGKFITDEIMTTGKFANLSLTHHYNLVDFDPNHPRALFVEQKFAKELSSVQNPKRPGCKILFYTLIKKKGKFDKGILKGDGRPVGSPPLWDRSPHHLIPTRSSQQSSSMSNTETSAPADPKPAAPAAAEPPVPSKEPPAPAASAPAEKTALPGEVPTGDENEALWATAMEKLKTKDKQLEEKDAEVKKYKEFFEAHQEEIKIYQDERKRKHSELYDKVKTIFGKEDEETKKLLDALLPDPTKKFDVNPIHHQHGVELIAYNFESKLKERDDEIKNLKARAMSNPMRRYLEEEAMATSSSSGDHKIPRSTEGGDVSDAKSKRRNELKEYLGSL